MAARGARYARNRDRLVEGMRALGFETLLEDRWLSPIIVTFFQPADPAFDFEGFYRAMKAKGFIIYPGKLTVADSFRIGCIGQVDAAVMGQVVAAAAEALDVGAFGAGFSPGLSAATPAGRTPKNTRTRKTTAVRRNITRSSYSSSTGEEPAVRAFA